MHKSHPVLVMILVLFSLNGYAGESVGKLYGSRWLSFEHEGGLISLLPATSTLQLLYQVQKLRNTKLTRQIELDKALEASQFGFKDALITAIIPGGLMYATMKNMERNQIESELANIKSEVSQLNRDLEMLITAVGSSSLSMSHLP